MKEFDLIDQIVSILGEQAFGEWVRVGPGDDCSVIAVSPDCEVVSSIDSLYSGVHFPESAPPELVGYRSMMVSLSDIAAMGAQATYVLINLCLPSESFTWALECAKGIKRAAEDSGVFVCGGNVARGPIGITVSAHGEVPEGKSILRSGASVGDSIFVSGCLGGAASYIRQISSLTYESPHYESLRKAFYEPSSCLGLLSEVRGKATSCIDISDGLIQDLGHILDSSNVGGRLSSSLIPVNKGANLNDALFGGDDYQLLCTSPTQMEGFYRIGEITQESGILVDERELPLRGYDHFLA